IEEWVDAPFVEFIDFADNEGSFDFVVAEKLYKDFSNYQQKAEMVLRAYLEYYNCYREILRVVAENKGVIYYS
ncbi:MAG: hypothetical protein LIP01_10485, partial [Tannerellaceae bacterium]|nr:hypothetical protein [Tannerellaceae bacterium]